MRQIRTVATGGISMVCPRCGHDMANEEANFCGRCGGPLRPGAIIPVDGDDDRQAPDGAISAQRDTAAPLSDRGGVGADSERGPLDPGAIGMVPRGDRRPLLQRPIIAAAWQEASLITPPMIDVPTPFEVILPPLSEQDGTE